MKANTKIPTTPLGLPELIALTAAVMALNALAIDMMLPALGIIGDDLGAARENDRQLVVVVYIIGNGVAQLFFGPIVDRFGRRRVLLYSLGGYLLGSMLSVFAGEFALLLAARAFQGVATAASRVAMIAIVRDLTSGRRMAQVMSLAITIFMAAPILAPGFGQLVLFAYPWQAIFVALGLYGAVIALWVFLRVPETLAPEARQPLSIQGVTNAYMTFITHKVAIGYTIASALCFGGLFGYIAASEQIFLELFAVGDLFFVFFGVIAGALGAATLANARFVERFGMRRLCHGAALVFVISNILHLVIIATIGESIWAFMFFMCISFFCIGLIGPNSSAIALEPMGRIAGAAAAANGFAGTTIAGVLGGLIGSFYNGTTTPLILGFAVLGIVSFAIILWVENGRLFETSARRNTAAEEAMLADGECDK